MYRYHFPLALLLFALTTQTHSFPQLVPSAVKRGSDFNSDLSFYMTPGSKDPGFQHRLPPADYASRMRGVHMELVSAFQQVRKARKRPPDPHLVYRVPPEFRAFYLVPLPATDPADLSNSELQSIQGLMYTPKVQQPPVEQSYTDKPAKVYLSDAAWANALRSEPLELLFLVYSLEAFQKAVVDVFRMKDMIEAPGGAADEYYARILKKVINGEQIMRIER
ncbi:MAG: hypothetical protein M1829_000868 [Trizodia sp. TS-e1964]|nr:MAG: hypothetical protein M1829_000868 [Trizodia sp. TS-e1964]